MAYQITSPKYSFFSFYPFGNDDCYPGRNKPLPLTGNGDLYFQLQVSCQSLEELTALIFADDSAMQLILQRMDGTELVNYATKLGPAFFSKYQTGTFEMTYLFTMDDYDLEGWGIKLNECFKFYTKLIIAEEQVTQYTSALFYYTNDTCFTSQVEYKCDEDNNGFRYCNVDPNFINIIRLPMYPANPQFKDAEKVYIDSEGNADVLSSTTQEEYNCQVGIFSELVHKKIKVAISSDVVFLSNERYSGGIRKNSDYTIGWEYPEQSIAPAEFKALATPLDIQNSNCDICDNDFFPICPVVHFITGAILQDDDTWLATISGCTFDTPPTGNIVLKISYKEAGTLGPLVFKGFITFAPDGTIVSSPQPFPFDHLQPDWDGIDIVGEDICMGSQTGTVYNPAFCTAPSVDSGFTWDPPPANIGIPWIYTIHINGSPVTIIGGIILGWMMANIVADNLVLSGTPDEVGNGPIDVQMANVCGILDVGGDVPVNP